MLLPTERLWLWLALSVVVLPWWAGGLLIAVVLAKDSWNRRRDRITAEKLPPKNADVRLRRVK